MNAERTTANPLAVGVAVAGLHVLIKRDGDGWHAQGLEIDYAASGDSVEDAKSTFVEGFVATIRSHIRRFGTIARMLKRQAPSEYFEQYLGEPHSDVLSCVTVERLPDAESLPPRLQNITFIAQHNNASA